MSQLVNPQSESFVDRRAAEITVGSSTRERRQFANSYQGSSPDAHELATAIDEYKLMHRRRFITYDEMLYVIKSLGYAKV